MHSVRKHVLSDGTAGWSYDRIQTLGKISIVPNDGVNRVARMTEAVGVRAMRNNGSRNEKPNVWL